MIRSDLRVQHDTTGATVRSADGRRVTYRPDPKAHRVAAIDEAGRVLFAFGEFGLGPGQFDTPLDAVLVAPAFPGEPLPGELSNIVWVAVADYGNQRVQIFELDGVFVGTLEDIETATVSKPCRLTWRPPVLEIETLDGARARTHVTTGLLAGAVPGGPAVSLGSAVRRERRLH